MFCVLTAPWPRLTALAHVTLRLSGVSATRTQARSWGNRASDRGDVRATRTCAQVRPAIVA